MLKAKYSKNLVEIYKYFDKKIKKENFNLTVKPGTYTIFVRA